MLNSTPEYVSAHQRDLAALKSDRGAGEALAARRRARINRMATVLRQARSTLGRLLRPRRTADARSGRPVIDGR